MPAMRMTVPCVVERPGLGIVLILHHLLQSLVPILSDTILVGKTRQEWACNS